MITLNKGLKIIYHRNIAILQLKRIHKTIITSYSIYTYFIKFTKTPLYI